MCMTKKIHSVNGRECINHEWETANGRNLKFAAINAHKKPQHQLDSDIIISSDQLECFLSDFYPFFLPQWHSQLFFHFTTATQEFILNFLY